MFILSKIRKLDVESASKWFPCLAPLSFILCDPWEGGWGLISRWFSSVAPLLAIAPSEHDGSGWDNHRSFNFRTLINFRTWSPRPILGRINCSIEPADCRSTAALTLQGPWPSAWWLHLLTPLQLCVYLCVSVQKGLSSGQTDDKIDRRHQTTCSVPQGSRLQARRNDNTCHNRYQNHQQRPEYGVVRQWQGQWPLWHHWLVEENKEEACCCHWCQLI